MTNKYYKKWYLKKKETDPVWYEKHLEKNRLRNKAKKAEKLRQEELKWEGIRNQLVNTLDELSGDKVGNKGLQ